MGEIRIITASAGSGKTRRLTEVLKDALVSEEARPDAIVATTFTNKAAAELRERARWRLLHEGRSDDAHRIAASRIGTVNSVAGRLVEEFAFELGLPPELRVIDDNLATEAMNNALSSVVTPEEESELSDLTKRLEEFEWQHRVRNIVETARTNGIQDTGLVESTRRSVASLLELLGEPAGEGQALDDALARALEMFIDGCEKRGCSKKTTEKAMNRARAALQRIRAGEALAWREWASLAGLQVAKEADDLVQPVHEAAADHDRHPQLRTDLQRAVELTFTLARRGLTAYQELKRNWGVVDFVDQEVLGLELLRNEQIRERLAEEIDLVLVDEFQDTSPLQLAIFLELAKIARSSIWVGDQKQAIFGFRGTDPALMNTAIEELLSGSDPALVDRTVSEILATSSPEQLTYSYRSRPELVTLTSDLFARAFAAHEIPAERVRLEPYLKPEDEPEGLGPVIEHWSLDLPDRRKTSQLADAVAAGVRDLLTADDQRVRDRVTGKSRRIEPGDVAVLCRTNVDSERVSAALENLAIPAEVPRIGLLETPEGRVAVAGLRLWADPRDRLAAAELARIIGFPERGDEWLAETLQESTEELFQGIDAVRNVRAARDASPDANPVRALEAVIEACGLRELCRRWGDAAGRLANLDALYAHAIQYRDSVQSQDLPAALGGVLRYLIDLEEAGPYRQKRIDQQAMRADGDAVVVSTWHRAKGLEWPVVVLFGLERERTADALRVDAASDWEQFSLEDPLADRWIRYWQSPFKGVQKGTGFKERFERHPENLRAVEQGEREALRILYVGWTRARDRLVLAAMAGKHLNGILGHLKDDNIPLLVEPAPTGEATWGGREITVAVRRTSPEEPVERSSEPETMVVPSGARAHPSAVLSPSSMEGAAEASEPVRIGEPLTISGSPDMSQLGNAVHGFLAADLTGLGAEREKIAGGLLRRWAVADSLQPADLLAAGDALRAWIGAEWPDAEVVPECPIYHRLESGTVVRGAVDVVLRLSDRLIVIDHKSVSGSIEAVREQASGFFGQLQAYALGLEAAEGKPVEAMFIHAPLSGFAVRVLADERSGEA